MSLFEKSINRQITQFTVYTCVLNTQLITKMKKSGLQASNIINEEVSGCPWIWYHALKFSTTSSPLTFLTVNQVLVHSDKSTKTCPTKHESLIEKIYTSRLQILYPSCSFTGLESSVKNANPNVSRSLNGLRIDFVFQAVVTALISSYNVIFFFKSVVARRMCSNLTASNQCLCGKRLKSKLTTNHMKSSPNHTIIAVTSNISEMKHKFICFCITESIFIT